MPRERSAQKVKNSAANLGFEAKLWLAADKLRSNMDAAEYKHVVLGELIDLIGTIGMGDKASRSKDILGRVYEYFLGQFASAEGKKGGQFYTPQSVVRLLFEMLAPYKGRIYDPCCGSGGMFVQSEKFVEAHGGKLGDISIYGQESNPTTRRLAVMNLALRGIEADFGPEHADTFRRDLHPDLRTDYVLANPPFNDSDWFRKDDDVRWQYGVPPRGNANFAWVQHFIHHLAPQQPRTVSELAATLKITDNAVRAHLVSLERDGLVQRCGTQRGVRKPHVSYGLTADAEHIFPKSYGLLLNHFIASVSRRLSARQMPAVMREVGHALAHEYMPNLKRKSRSERIAAALDVIRSLGGSPATFRVDGQHIVRGNSCPLAAVMAEHHAACLVLETLLNDITGLPVSEHCTRGRPPSCCFEIG